MSNEKPTWIDVMALGSAIVVAAAPGLMIAGNLPVLGLPYAILLAALVLTLAKSLFRLPLIFGLSPARWATILVLLSALACLGTGLGFLHTHDAPVPELYTQDYMNYLDFRFMVSIFKSVTIWVAIPAIACALAILFSGQRLGPDPRRTQS